MPKNVQNLVDEYLELTNNSSLSISNFNMPDKLPQQLVNATKIDTIAASDVSILESSRSNNIPKYSFRIVSSETKTKSSASGENNKTRNLPKEQPLKLSANNIDQLDSNVCNILDFNSIQTWVMQSKPNEKEVVNVVNPSKIISKVKNDHSNLNVKQPSPNLDVVCLHNSQTSHAQNKTANIASSLDSNGKIKNYHLATFSEDLVHDNKFHSISWSNFEATIDSIMNAVNEILSADLPTSEKEVFLDLLLQQLTLFKKRLIFTVSQSKQTKWDKNVFSKNPISSCSSFNFNNEGQILESSKFTKSRFNLLSKHAPFTPNAIIHHSSINDNSHVWDNELSGTDNYSAKYMKTSTNTENFPVNLSQSTPRSSDISSTNPNTGSDGNASNNNLMQQVQLLQPSSTGLPLNVSVFNMSFPRSNENLTMPSYCLLESPSVCSENANETLNSQGNHNNDSEKMLNFPRLYSEHIKSISTENVSNNDNSLERLFYRVDDNFEISSLQSQAENVDYTHPLHSLDTNNEFILINLAEFQRNPESIVANQPVSQTPRPSGSGYLESASSRYVSSQSSKVPSNKNTQQNIGLISNYTVPSKHFLTNGITNQHIHTDLISNQMISNVGILHNENIGAKLFPLSQGIQPVPIKISQPPVIPISSVISEANSNIEFCNQEICADAISDKSIQGLGIWNEVYPNSEIPDTQTDENLLTISHLSNASILPFQNILQDSIISEMTKEGITETLHSTSQYTKHLIGKRYSIDKEASNNGQSLRKKARFHNYVSELQSDDLFTLTSTGSEFSDEEILNMNDAVPEIVSQNLRCQNVLSQCSSKSPKLGTQVTTSAAQLQVTAEQMTSSLTTLRSSEEQLTKSALQLPDSVTQLKASSIHLTETSAQFATSEAPASGEHATAASTPLPVEVTKFTASTIHMPESVLQFKELPKQKPLSETQLLTTAAQLLAPETQRLESATQLPATLGKLQTSKTQLPISDSQLKDKIDSCRNQFLILNEVLQYLEEQVQKNAFQQQQDLDNKPPAEENLTTLISEEEDKKKERVKRPMNAFMIWSREERKVIKSECPGMHHSKISKILGHRWKLLANSQKEKYLTEQGLLSKQHKEKNPNYHYRPRKKGSSSAKGD